MQENETREDLIERVARKLVGRADELLDAEYIAPADLDKLSDVIKEAAGVLGVTSALDAEEQRAKIRVLLHRAEEGSGDRGPLEIIFGPGVEDLAQ